jgi:hypothetical protein
MIRRLYVALATLIVLFAPVTSFSKTLETEEIRTTILHSLDLTPKQLKTLRTQKFNHVTIYVGWSEIEAKEGHFDFSEIDKNLRLIRSHGFKVILVLDASGRYLFNSKGTLNSTGKPIMGTDGKLDAGKNSIPDWIRSKASLFAFDFSGNRTNQISFYSEPAMAAVEKFFQASSRHFTTQFPGMVTGFGIGFQEEHEIKFGQTGYQWRDYGSEAQSAFQRAKPVIGSMPIINYNNQIDATPRREPGLTPWMEFREDRLVDVTCRMSRAIRSQSGRAVGYFGEFFTSHDAIYAMGAVDRLAPCLDIAVADFNFYDGYAPVPDPWVVRLMVNHMKNVGYKRILAGVYGERLPPAGAGKNKDLNPLAASVVLASSEAGYSGFELAGLHPSVSEWQIKQLPLELTQDFVNLIPSYKARNKACDSGRPRIGIYASKANFYFWHGERSQGKNIHRESLIRLFQLLCESGQFSPEIIGDGNLQNLNGKYAAVFVPHQAALSDESVAQLTKYVRNGGKLIQDMRLGEFATTGENRGGWMSKTFGIRGIEWGQSAGQFRIKSGAVLTLDPASHAGFRYANLIPMSGFTLLAPALKNPNAGIGILGKNTLAFGAMPHLVEHAEQKQWRSFLLDSMETLLEKRHQEPDK